MTLPEKLWCQSCGLQRETKRQKEKEGKKERKTRIRSFCVEITGPFCWASQLFCLKSLLLPPDCRNRQNISQLFHLRVGKQTMMSALSSFFFFFFCSFSFLSASCLPSSVSASVSGSVGKHLPLGSPGQAGNSSECQQRAHCHRTPHQALIRTDPSEWKQRGKKTQRGLGGGGDRAADDELVEEWLERSSVNIKRVGGATTCVADWGNPPLVWVTVRKRARPRQPFHLKILLNPPPLPSTPPPPPPPPPLNLCLVP